MQKSNNSMFKPTIQRLQTWKTFFPDETQCEICGYFDVYNPKAAQALRERDFQSPQHAETLAGCNEKNKVHTNGQSKSKHDAYERGFRFTAKGVSGPAGYWQPMRRDTKTNNRTEQR